jgi:hypothetical protein
MNYKKLEEYGYVKGDHITQCKTCDDRCNNVTEDCFICLNCAINSFKRILKIKHFETIEKILERYTKGEEYDDNFKVKLMEDLSQVEYDYLLDVVKVGV